jgi:hypothetical protein
VNQFCLNLCIIYSSKNLQKYHQLYLFMGERESALMMNKSKEKNRPFSKFSAAVVVIIFIVALVVKVLRRWTRRKFWVKE